MRHPWKHNWATWAATAVILIATLTPAGSGIGARPGPAFCLACGSRGLADLLLNIALFTPFGAALAVRRGGVVRPVVRGGLLSFGIEVAQHFIPGRDPNLADVACNTLGAAVGVALVVTAGWWLAPPPRRAAVLCAGSMLLAFATLLGAGLLLAPSLPETTYYGQWTARFQDMAHYEGRVVAASVGGLPIESRRVSDSDALRERLARGEELSVEAIAGPPPNGLAPIFSIYDDLGREIVLLGVEGEEVVLRMRTKAAELKLDQPDVTLPAAFRGIESGEMVRLRLRRSGRGYCFEVNDSHTCSLGFGLEDGWGVLYFDGDFSLRLREVLGLVWLAALFVPAGFWIRGMRDAAVVCACIVAGLTLLPLAVGLLATPALGYVAAFAGIGAGVGLRRWLQRVGRTDVIVRSFPQGRHPSAVFPITR